ncbi:MAG: hypothetical protein KIT02_03115 [Devosia sp.]|uniref:hypothetical protein n=1 Tax=Devosia sp. TaxID=1871048 RepID=UPI0024C593CE|nr:hypothetical protein [Devosia sp.]UYO00231.1 MAG: hypothetical protein KIT02_03115 [Devosia sp.]
MRSIIKAIAAILKAMPRLVLERAQIAGRWIQRLVAVPAPVEPEAPEPPTARDTADEEHLAAIRTAAAHIAAGQLPPSRAVDKLTEMDFEWLAAISRPMLCKIVGAPDADLLAHIRGNRPLRGVLARDHNAVNEYRAAMRRKRREDELNNELEFVPA